MSRDGPTGLELVPIGTAMRSGAFAVGLHRGVVKGAVGWLGVEAGMRTPDIYDNPNRDDWNDETVFFGKFGITRALRWLAGDAADRSWLPDIAAGAEDSIRHALTAPLALGHPHTAPGEPDPQSFYGVASWSVEAGSWPLEAVIGAGTGRFSRRAFGGVSVIPSNLFGRTLKLIGEYAGTAAEVGARIALSRNLRLDFGMLLHAMPEPGAHGRHWNITIDRGLVGASQMGRITFDWLWLKPKEPPAKT